MAVVNGVATGRGAQSNNGASGLATGDVLLRWFGKNLWPFLVPLLLLLGMHRCTD